MSFLSQFASHFTNQEKQTELYQLWSSIGVNTEKAFLEEQNALNTRMTDINTFDETTLRSWLAFFLAKIPYRTSATTQLKVKFKDNVKTGDKYKYGRTVIPKYTQLQTDDGMIYTQMEEIVLVGENERVVTCVQGKIVEESGTYNTIIKIQANNPDLSYMSVTLDDVEIPEVSYVTSYDNLKYMGGWKPQPTSTQDWGGTPFLTNSYGGKGEFYTVIADGSTKFEYDGLNLDFKVGDIVVYDGVSWQSQSQNSNLKPIQFSNSYGIPSNGYYAYYYDGYLYIKIFSGTEIEDPTDKKYKIRYIASDGVEGVINENTLSYINTFRDSNEEEVSLEITNTKSTVGVNEPSVGKLSIFLKQKLYASTTVSSVPEYTAWFKAQPEVGDCIVLSDYERWVRRGKQASTSEASNVIEVMMVDPQGQSLDSDTGTMLLERIVPYKDVGFLKVRTFEKVECFLKFNYTDSSDTTAFETYVKSKAAQYFNLTYLQSINGSLFEDLDLSNLMYDIQKNCPYTSKGLTLKGYHYTSDIHDNQYEDFSIEGYSSDAIGKGYYYFDITYKSDKKLDYTGNSKPNHLYLYEDLKSPKVSGIYINTTKETVGWGEVGTVTITDISSEGVSKGTHKISVETAKVLEYGGVLPSIQGSSDYDIESIKLQCFWGMQNEGILSIGKDYGLRSLHDIEIEKYTEDK